MSLNVMNEEWVDDALKTILLVEDDEDLREVVHIVLEQPSLYIAEARDAVMALRLAKEMIPHLMLLDGTLPGIRSLEVVQALKQDDETRNIRIVMLADRDDPEEFQRGRAAGVDHYLLKPFDPKVLAKTVEEMLRPFKGRTDH